ncbi:MAG: SGNH/GDSL hydrolase family protein [Pseudomonadota bacterium]
MKFMTTTMACAILGAGSAAAASLDATYTSFLVFGDSLSDPGNLAAFGAAPPPPYVGGRFSNGPVWAEDIAADFAISANFAFGGARAGSDTAVPDFDEQLALYDPNLIPQGDRPLAAIWLGANDLFEGIFTGTVADAITDATMGIANGIAALQASNVNDFVVFNLPDLGQTPLYDLVLPPFSSGASDATNAFNAALDGVIAGAEANGATVTKIDINATFDALLANPTAFGVSEADIPCLFLSDEPAIQAAAGFTALLLGEDLVCSDAEAAERAFFDLVHPNATVHSAIADEVRTALAPAPVPLPATLPLLIGALAGLGLARRRVAR